MKLLLTIPFTIYIWLCVGCYSKAFCQNASLCHTEKSCSKQKNQYLDYSKFILNNEDSDEFDTKSTENITKYFELKNWSTDFANNDLDSLSQSVFRLTGKELEINIENWKIENDIPQFLIGNIQKKITNTLGLYEWRIKFDDFFTLAAKSSISNQQSFHYQPIDYSGDMPNQLSVDSWHYFPVDENNSVFNYTANQCKDKIEKLRVNEVNNPKNAQYDCKACNCKKSICFDAPIYEQYHTLSLALTTEYAAFFVDGVLMYVNTLGANDTRSICPLNEEKCTKNNILSLSSAIVQNGNDGDFALRNDMWNHLTTGNEVKWTIDYFRKYDFKKDESNDVFLKSYNEKPFSFNAKILNRKSPQMNFLSDSSLVVVSKNNELLIVDKDGKTRTIIDKKTNEIIKIGGDFVISPTNDIFFVNNSGYIEMLKNDKSGHFYKKKLLRLNPIQRVKNTDYQDVTILENEGEIEVIFKTRKNSIGRYFQNRGKWYFIEMTSKASVKIEGDIQTGSNGKIFYRGSDGHLHGVQIKGKKRQSFHINVRPLGSKTPKVAKVNQAFVITKQDEIIYINEDNLLVHLYLEKRRYKIKYLTKKSKLKCEQVAGGLVWMNDKTLQQLLFFDKNNRLSALKYNSDNQNWNINSISATDKKSKQRLFNKKYSIAYHNSKILHLNHKNEFIVYELAPSEVQMNHPNYALYIDETTECQDVKTKDKQTLNKEARRLSDF